MTIEKATIEDAEEILKLQKTVYVSEAELHEDYSIPPLTQSLSDIKRQFVTHTFLKVIEDGNIIASVRAYEGNGTCYINRLIVDTEYQRKGIGTQLMDLIEKEFSHLKRYEVFTGKKSDRNLKLYDKLGYKFFAQQNLNAKTILVYLEKRV
ncbi:MAG: GNAT family N-acetyltransferase [Vallitaleaceae bacterium]|nr:GNAT family N-acetyltransferase [Vallitaleaceae bacterium]